MTQKTQPSKIPAEISEAIRNYVENHRSPGGFLTAVLSNDLMGAVHYGEPESLASLTEISAYIYETLPGNCWGDAEAVEAWISMPNDNRNTIYLVH